MPTSWSPSLPRQLVCLILLSLLPALTASEETTRRLDAGDLVCTVDRGAGGIRLSSLSDRQTGHEFLAQQPWPLFVLSLRQTGTGKEVKLGADQGWQGTGIADARPRGAVRLSWSSPVDTILQGISVQVTLVPDAAQSALGWNLAIDNRTTNWSVWRVLFPQIVLADMGELGEVYFPRGPGEVQPKVWRRDFTYHGHYTDAWCTMQFMAAYRTGDSPTGLYVALQDPLGGTKDVDLRSDPGAGTLRMGFDVPAPNMGVAGNDFTLEGQGVWRLLRGDWYDAAMVYRAWAAEEARWWPRLSSDGRKDTPRWMRELNAWAMTGGAPEDCVANVQQFQRYLDVPVGFHWYNWHQIPFDNDYPHYFPTKPGIATGVRQLQDANAFVMPYINGRLWDTKDRGAEDAQFTSVALPAAAKKENGQPFVESYGSKETNGQPVRLAVMCPATPLWQKTVGELVRRLLREVGTKAVYIDQVAAAAPALCMDKSHGHPLGGGHWWQEGYRRMLDEIRRAVPPDTMLTTECNGEPYLRWFDGYLTWHWQHDGQVPAFPAVYAGAIQNFGRAYRGGDTKDLALRMKAGQQLVFGEQIGWIDPGVVRDKENAEFFRQVVRLRARFSRYFYAGEMLHPPTLTGQIGRVEADWQWSGQWPVTTDAVLTGAWRLPREGRVLLLFVNVSSEPVKATLQSSASALGFKSGSLRCRVVRMNQADRTLDLSASFAQGIECAPSEAVAWELSSR